MTREDPYDRATRLVEQIFEAPSSQAGWERILEAISQEMSVGALALLVARTSAGAPAFLLGHGLESRFLPGDALPPTPDPGATADLPVGQVFETPPGSARFAASPLFQNVLAPLGLPPGPALNLLLARNKGEITGAVLVMSLDPDWRPSEDDRALLVLLSPYLVRAAWLGSQLTDLRTGVTALLDILDALVLGVVLLDVRGDLSFANQSAAALLGVPAGLATPGASKGKRAAQAREALRALSRRSLVPNAAELARHAEGGPGLHVVAAPLERGAAPVGVEPRSNTRFATALFISDPVSGEARARGFAALYGLTPAEERLALKLGAGRSLADAAEQLGIRPATARGVLRSVFKKTGTHRQAEVVRLVLAAAGQIRANPPGV